MMISVCSMTSIRKQEDEEYIFILMHEPDNTRISGSGFLYIRLYSVVIAGTFLDNSFCSTHSIAHTGYSTLHTIKADTR